MNPTLHGGMSRKLISNAEPAKEGGIVETIKGTVGPTQTAVGQVGCHSHECEQPIASPVFPNKLIPKHASITTHALDEIRHPGDGPLSHWGLNE